MASTGCNGYDGSQVITKKGRKYDEHYSDNARRTPGYRERNRFPVIGRIHPAEERTRQPHARCGGRGAGTTRFSDFKGTALQADRKKGSAVPQIREQIAFLTERASHVGGKSCKKGERQGRGGTRHRQERKPENS